MNMNDNNILIYLDDNEITRVSVHFAISHFLFTFATKQKTEDYATTLCI